MLIISIDEKEALTLYQSWWRNPEIAGIQKGSEEYHKLREMWEEATGLKIQDLEKLVQKEQEEKNGPGNEQCPD